MSRSKFQVGKFYKRTFGNVYMLVLSVTPATIEHPVKCRVMMTNSDGFAPQIYYLSFYPLSAAWIEVEKPSE